MEVLLKMEGRSGGFICFNWAVLPFALRTLDVSGTMWVDKYYFAAEAELQPIRFVFDMRGLES